MFNQYVRGELGYKTDATYYVLAEGIQPWDYGRENQNRFVDVSESLRSAFAKNPHMKVFVGSGYYDLATPYFATEYTFSHMGLNPAARIDLAYRLVLGRLPDDHEKSEITRYLGAYRQTLDAGDHKGNANLAAWASVCQTLFASGEFRYVY
jgi:hypothetical protein